MIDPPLFDCGSVPSTSGSDQLCTDFLADEPAPEDTSPSARSGLETEPRRVGRFLLLDWLGEGSMGVVHAAFDPQLDRRIAVKLLRRSPTSDPSVARFLREAQAMARLSHPHVVHVYEVGWAGEHGFIAMELVPRTMSNWLAGGSRTWREILDVYLQAGRGLAAAHAAGLVHRDFKPANVLIGTDGRVRVADFGLACGGDDEPGSLRGRSHRMWRSGSELLALSLTAPGATLGTPAYMSPEQHLDQSIGPASDQFSFCVALFEGLFGVLPFAGSSLAELAESVTSGRMREPPTEARVPRWIVGILRRGLSPRPEDRYSDMDELLRALARDPMRRRRRIAASVVLAVAAAFSGFVAARSQEGISELVGIVGGAVLDPTGLLSK